MTGSDPRGRLLAEAAADDPMAAISTLRWAMAWAAGTLSESSDSGSAPDDDPWPAPEDTAALEQVIALEEALRQSGGLAEQIRAALARARIGPAVQRHVDGRLVELARARTALSAGRERWQEVEHTEADIHAVNKERAVLEERIAALRVLERENSAVPELRRQAELLGRRETAMQAELDDADDALVSTAERVIVIGAERLADVRARTSDLLARLAEVERSYAQDRARLVEAQKALTDAQARYERLGDVVPEIEAVERYIEADIHLSTALSGITGHPVSADAEGLRATLAQLRERLSEVDAALGRAVQSHQQARESALRMVTHAEGLNG